MNTPRTIGNTRACQWNLSFESAICTRFQQGLYDVQVPTASGKRQSRVTILVIMCKDELW